MFIAFSWKSRFFNHPAAHRWGAPHKHKGPLNGGVMRWAEWKPSGSRDPSRTLMIRFHNDGDDLNGVAGFYIIIQEQPPCSAVDLSEMIEGFSDGWVMYADG